MTTPPPEPPAVLDVEAVRACVRSAQSVGSELPGLPSSVSPPSVSTSIAVLPPGVILAICDEVDRLRAALRRSKAVMEAYLPIEGRGPHRHTKRLLYSCSICSALAAARALLDGTDG